MGSVAGKLLAALAQVNLWLVDGRPDRGRVLVCIDASPAAAQVVDHVGRMLCQSPSEITLFHVIRSPDPVGGYEVHPSDNEAAKKLEVRARKALVPVFEKALGAVTINYGVFANKIIRFLIVAFAAFMLVRGMNRLKRQEEAAPAAPTTKDCPHCFSKIAVQAGRCPF